MAGWQVAFSPLVMDGVVRCPQDDRPYLNHGRSHADTSHEMESIFYTDLTTNRRDWQVTKRISIVLQNYHHRFAAAYLKSKLYPK